MKTWGMQAAENTSILADIPNWVKYPTPDVFFLVYFTVICWLHQIAWLCVCMFPDHRCKLYFLVYIFTHTSNTPFPGSLYTSTRHEYKYYVCVLLYMTRNNVLSQDWLSVQCFQWIVAAGTGKIENVKGHWPADMMRQLDEMWITTCSYRASYRSDAHHHW